MRVIFDLFYVLIAIAISPMVVYRVIRHKRYRTGWAQRFGKISRNYPEKKCIWLHAVSVGEVNAAKTIVDELQKKFSNFEIVISTTTDTGFARATNVFGKSLEVFYFPLDFSWIMRRAFRRIQPSLCLLMELEVWPNFVNIAHKLNVPVVVVNGRISDRSFSRYKIVRPFAAKIFSKVSLTLAQTDEYAERFKQIGCPNENVIVTGSLKYDTAQITDKVEGADELAQRINISCHCEPEQSEGAGISKPADKMASVAEFILSGVEGLPRNDVIEGGRIWVAGATGPGEEEIILDVFKELIKQFSDLRLVIVPRKPERFDEVAQLIEQSGFNLIRYSEIKTATTDASIKSTIDYQLTTKDFVILGDTMGDLRKFYSLATVIFVGRSLIPMGGSDMMEAAALGKCTIFGTYAFNFQQAVDALVKDNGAIMVRDKEDLLATMRKCLTESDYAERIAKNGREVIRKNQGATKKTIDQIAGFLNG